MVLTIYKCTFNLVGDTAIPYGPSRASRPPPDTKNPFVAAIRATVAQERAEENASILATIGVLANQQFSLRRTHQSSLTLRQ